MCGFSSVKMAKCNIRMSKAQSVTKSDKKRRFFSNDLNMKSKEIKLCNMVFNCVVR